MSLDMEQVESSAVGPAESLRQPVWHVIVLSILTCFAYPIYWFYKNWRDLKAAALQNLDTPNETLNQFADISPMLRTIGLFVPIFDIYIALTLIKGIAEINPKDGAYSAKHPLIASGLVMGSIIALLYLCILPGVLYLLSFTAAIPLAVAQSWLNNYWRSVEPEDVIVRQVFTGKELIAVILGGLLLGLILAGYMCGVTVDGR